MAIVLRASTTCGSVRNKLWDKQLLLCQLFIWITDPLCMRGSNGVLQSPLGMRNLRCEGHLSPENSPTEAFGVHLLHTWKQWSMMSVERLDMIERINHTWISADLAQDSTWQTNPRLVLQIETGPDLGRALHGAVLLETYLCEPLRNITRNAVLKICFCSFRTARKSHRELVSCAANHSLHKQMSSSTMMPYWRLASLDQAT